MRRGVLNKPEEFNVTIQPVFLMDKKYGKRNEDKSTITTTKKS